MEKEVKFPVYRKYPHNRTWFKVLGDDQFEELQVLGERYTLIHHKATILPDFNYIIDLVHNYEPYWEPVTEEAWEERLRWCEVNLTAM